MPVNIKADQIVNSNLEAFSFFFTDLQEGQGLVFNTTNNRWENAFVESSDDDDDDTSTTTETGPFYAATLYGSNMNSLFFDGTSKLTKSQSNSSSNWTMSLWVKMPNMSSSQYLFATGTGSPSQSTTATAINNGIVSSSFLTGVITEISNDIFKLKIV